MQALKCLRIRASHNQWTHQTQTLSRHTQAMTGFPKFLSNCHQETSIFLYAHHLTSGATRLKPQVAQEPPTNTQMSVWGSLSVPAAAALTSCRHVAQGSQHWFIPVICIIIRGGFCKTVAGTGKGFLEGGWGAGLCLPTYLPTYSIYLSTNLPIYLCI